MAHEALRGFLQIGILVGGCGFILMFMQPPNSAGFVLSVCSALMGLVFIIGVILVSRFLREK